MQLDAADASYIRSKRKIYLLLFVLGILARFAAVFYHPGFAVLNIILLIGFMTQFVPALDRGGFSNGLQVLVVGLVAASVVIPIPLLGLCTVVLIGVLDAKLYKGIKSFS